MKGESVALTILSTLRSVFSFRAFLAHPFLSLLLIANLNSVRLGWQVFDEHSSYGSLLLHSGYPWTPTEPVELAEAVTSSPDSAW